MPFARKLAHETFADDGSTVNSTQTYSEDLTQQTLGAGA